MPLAAAAPTLLLEAPRGTMAFAAAASVLPGPVLGLSGYRWGVKAGVGGHNTRRCGISPNLRQEVACGQGQRERKATDLTFPGLKLPWLAR